VGASFRAATPGGLGASFARSLSRWAWPVHVSCAALLAVALFGVPGLVLLAASAAAAFAWSALLARRLGGITGDVLGGSVELGELAALLTGAILVHRELI
jgi:adenosylcobinamide-GDP ribazoletransferase